MMTECTDCGKTTDKLIDRRCADCIASDTGPSADRMHDNRDRLWTENEMRRDADANRRGEALNE